MERTLLYVLLISALLSLAGLALETLLSLARRSQRSTWVVCLVLSLTTPFTVKYWVERSDALASYQELTLPQWPGSESIRPTRSLSASTNIPSAAASPVLSSKTDAGIAAAALRSRLEPIALIGWLLASITMLGVVAGSAAVLGRKLRALESVTLWGAAVRVSDSLGPAVVGLRTAQIVVPRWLLLASASVQKAAIVHETEHLRSHDARLLFAGVVLVSLMPWNPILWWQLWRLRFAIEKDCDQRVIARGLDAIDYARALVTVAKLHLASPFGVVALGERATQVEKRIRRLLGTTIRHRMAWGTGALFALLSCLAVAVELKPPNAMPPPWPRTPDESPFYARALSVARERYPELFSGKFTGTVEIHVDLSLEGSITGTRTYSYPAGPIDYSSSPNRDVEWSNLLRRAEEGYRASGTADRHFLGWYGPSHHNGLYLSYGTYRWPEDPGRNPVRALQLVDAVHPDFIQGACYTDSYPGSPKILTVLFNDDGAITKESWSDTPGKNGARETAEHFKSLGYDPSELAHWGYVPTYLHGFPPGCRAPAGSLYYAWPRRPTDPIIDFKAERHVLSPLEAVYMRENGDVVKRVQRLFECYFPDLWRSGPSSEGQFVLLLLDSEGRVIAQDQGLRPATDPIKLQEKGVAGHRTQPVTSTAATTRNHKQVEIVVTRTAEDDQG
jgi:beta-lactamase regulating signal transducer with metallopeptidase domain